MNEPKIVFLSDRTKACLQELVDKNMNVLIVAKTFSFTGKFTQNRNTYSFLDGELHSFDDQPAIVRGESQWWYKNGMKHRGNDLPAYISHNRVQHWYKEGRFHRDNDLPAVICYDGKQYWYKEGLLHRDNDFPAVVYSNGTKEWYKEGKRHRENDLPANILYNGTKQWYKEGKLHRDNDLPAIICYDGKKYFYKEGMPYKNSKWQRFGKPALLNLLFRAKNGFKLIKNVFKNSSSI